MTLTDLQKFVSEGQTQSDVNLQTLLNKCKGKPFYSWVPNKFRNTQTFNSIIGLPKKNGVEFPLFYYENMVYNALFVPHEFNKRPLTEEEEKRYRQLETDALKITQNKQGNVIMTERELKDQKVKQFIFPFKVKHVWIKKATGLGITEFILRIMLWLAMSKPEEYKDSQMVIVVGPNQDLAIKLIKRMKAMLEPHGVYFDSKETVLELPNNCRIEAYPSHNLSAFRSLTNPKFIFIDEADHFPVGQQDEVRHVAERYIAKSDPFIVMVSTPNQPGGLFEKIEKEPIETCIYKKMFLDWTYGLGKIYTTEEIENAKRSPSWLREYCLAYTGGIGNTFSQQSIDKCVTSDYNPDLVIPGSSVSVGLDPAFGGSSMSAIVVTRYSDGKVQVLDCIEIENAEYQDVIDKVFSLKKKWGISTLYCDAANPIIWKPLKRMFHESDNEKYVFAKIAEYTKSNIKPSTVMRVIPVPFSINHLKMLQHLSALLDKGFIQIHPRFENLITSLKSAVSIDYKLDKTRSAHNDLLDALRLSVQLYDIK